MTNISLLAHLPSNFEIDYILKKEKSNVTKRKNLKAAIYYILDVLYNMSIQRKYRDIFEIHGGYPLSSKRMNDILGKRYLEALNLLEKYGVIIRSDSYKSGEQSKLVSLTEKYSSTGIKIDQIPKDANFSAKILSKKLSFKSKNEKALNKIPFIAKWFNPTRISVIEKIVHGFIEFYRLELMGRIPTKMPKGRTLDEIQTRINLRTNCMIDTMKSFMKGEMRLCKTGKDNRLHSFLSNTKKELRTLYLFDGKPLYSLDLKSSQPYFFTYLLNPKNWVFIKQDIFPELFTDILTPEELQQLYSTPMFGGFRDIKPTMSNNKPRFYDILWENDFYSLLVERAKAENLADIFPDRAAAKKAIMMLLFDEAWYKDQSPEFNLFSKWYPHEAELIIFIKRISRRVKLEKTNPKKITNLLPILLQRIESKLILEDVCEVISRELPDAPLLPVHDCIHTTEEYVEDVKLIMERELKRIVGITPGIKIEKFSQQQTLNELSILADEDIGEIMDKKSKSNLRIGLKPPLLLELPVKGFDMLLSSRYTNPNFVDDGNESIIRLIDDTIEIKPVGNILRR